MPEELSREEKRAMRKAEKRKAKLGAEPTHDLQEPKGNSRVTQQASHVRDTKDTVGPDKSTKKQNHIGNGEGNENDSRKSKRRKHSEDPSPSTSSQAANLRTNVQPNTDARGDEPLQDVTKKKIKLQKDQSPNESRTPNQTLPVPESSKKMKKLKKTHAQPATLATFPDPSSDDLIPESSQKALLYAYEFSRKSSEQNHGQWKFSKAKQNWLVRHIWYDDAVPEKYVSLVVHYLQSVMGGAREAIIKGCNILLAASPPPVAVPIQNAVESSNDNHDVTGRKVTFVLDQAPNVNVNSIPASDAAEKRVDIRRTRARLLLDAMTISETS